MFNKLFYSVIAAIFGALLCLSPPAVAKLYKWVDENGITQYTETPPLKGDFNQVKPPPKPAVDPQKAQDEMDKRLQSFQQRRDDAARNKAEADKTAAEKAEKAAKCDKARGNLTYLQTHARVRVTDKDGNVSLLGEDKHQEKIKQANEAIKEYCK